MKHLLCVILCAMMIVTSAAHGEPSSEKSNHASPAQPGKSDKPAKKKDGVPRPKPVKGPSAKELDDSIRKGIAFLVSIQNKNGSWGSPRRTKGLNIYASVPGSHHAFRVACTSLVVSAMIECGVTDEDAVKALERGEAYLIEELPKVRRADAIALYNVWTHAYGINALVDMHERTSDADRKKLCKKLIKQQIERLERYESVNGGWGYYDFAVGAKKPSSNSTSFTTATGLVALYKAQNIGIYAPRKLVQRAVKSVKLQQKKDHTYLYGDYMKWSPMYDINRPGGSLGRSQACNAAMRFFGDDTVTDDVLRTWLDRLIVRNDWLGIGRKRPRPHESWFAVAGYFYYYGHHYAAYCIEMLPPKDRPFYQRHIAAILIKLQEKDGSWWDFPFYDYHQQYGTALTVMALNKCRVVE